MFLKSLISMLVLTAVPTHAGELPSYLPAEKAAYKDTLVADCNGIVVLERAFADTPDKQLFAMYSQGLMQDYFFPLKFEREFSKMNPEKTQFPQEIKVETFKGLATSGIEFNVDRSWFPSKVWEGFSFEAFFMTTNDNQQSETKVVRCETKNEDISEKMQKIEAHLKKYGAK